MSSKASNKVGTWWNTKSSGKFSNALLPPAVVMGKWEASRG